MILTIRKILEGVWKTLVVDDWKIVVYDERTKKYYEPTDWDAGIVQKQIIINVRMEEE